MNQEQKEIWKIHKNVEMKQCTLEELLGERKNFKKGNCNIPQDK